MSHVEMPTNGKPRRGIPPLLYIDEDWLATGEFSDERIHRRFRNYNLRKERRAARLRAAV